MSIPVLVDTKLSTKLPQAKTSPNGCYLAAIFPKDGGGYDLLPISDVNYKRTLTESIQALSDSTGNYQIYRFVNKSANFSQVLLASQKIEAIDIRYISGTPVIAVGIAPAGEEIIYSQEIAAQIDNSDFNVPVGKSYNTGITVYFSVSGGNVSISMLTRKTVFE